MKRDFLRRSLALAVAVSMTVSSFPGAAFAEEAVYEEIVADDAVEVADVGTDEIVADDAAVVAEEVAEAEVAETPLEAEAPAEDASIEIETVEEVSADEVAELYAGTTPAKVDGVAVDEDNNLTWYADVAADGYEISVTGADNKEYKDGGNYLWKTGLATSIGTEDLTNADGDGMVSGTYSVKVRAVNNYYDATTGEWQRLEGEWSNPVNYTVKAAVTPDAVSNFKVSEDGKFITWNSDGADRYEISVKDAQGREYYSYISSEWNSETQKYDYKPVYNYVSWNSYSPRSNSLRTYTQQADGSYKPVTVTNAEGKEEDVTAFALGEAYTVSVRAVNFDGSKRLESAWSAPVSFTLKTQQAPSKMATPVFDEKEQALSWYCVDNYNDIQMEIKDAAGNVYYNGYDWNYIGYDPETWESKYEYVLRYPVVNGNRLNVSEQPSWKVYNQTGTEEPVAVKDANGNEYHAFKAGETYTVRMRSRAWNNNSTSSKDQYLYGEWSDPVNFTVKKPETINANATPGQVSGVWVSGKTLTWEPVKNEKGYNTVYEVAVTDVAGKTYYAGITNITGEDGKQTQKTNYWRPNGSYDGSMGYVSNSASLSNPILYTYVAVDDGLKEDIHKETGDKIRAFEEGNTYKLSVRALYAKDDPETGKTVEVAGAWSNTVTYSIPKADKGVNAAPAKVTGLTLKTEDVSAPVLQWNYVQDAERYEALITDAAGYQYYADYELKDGVLVPEYRSVGGTGYYPSCAISSLKGLKSYVKAAGVSVATVTDATGKDLETFVAGQTYSIQVRAVNAYRKWNIAEQEYDEAVEQPGEWSDAVTYTPGAVAPITDLAYVEEDEDAYYFTYSAVPENSSIYYQIATDDKFTSTSLLGTENSWRSNGSSAYKLRINKDVVKFVPGTTYYVRAVNSTTYPKKEEIAQMAIPVASFVASAEAVKAPKNITGLKLYEETESSFVFHFDAVLDYENGDHFILQYTDVAQPAETDWVSGNVDSSYIWKSVLHEGTNYVRAVAFIYDEDGERVYGEKTVPVAVAISRATSAVGELQLIEKTQDRYVFKITGTPRKDEKVEFWYSESPEFTSDRELTVVRDEEEEIYDEYDNYEDIVYEYEARFHDLTPGKTYYVRARVINDEKDGADRYSAFSNVVTVKAEMARVHVSASSIASKSITLAMNKVNEDGYLTGYQIQKKVGSKYVTLVRTTNNTYKDSNLSSDKTYTYRVRPYYYDSEAKTTTNGTWAYFQATTWGSALNLNATPKSSTSVKLTWQKVTGAKGYEIYRRVAGSATTTVSNGYGNGFGKYTLVKKITKASTKSYTDKKLTSGLQYEYMVRAYKTVGKKKYYIYEGAYVDMSFGASVNIKREVNNADGSVKIYWTQVYAGDGYVVEQYDEKTDKWTAVKKLKKSTGSTTLPATTKRTSYRIRAYKGTEYSYASRSIEVAPVLAAATGVKAVANAADGSITVSWNPVAGADYYMVYRTTSSWSEYTKNTKTYTYWTEEPVAVYEADPTRVSGYKAVDYDERTATTIVDRPIKYTANGTTRTLEEGPVPGVKYYYFVKAYAKGAAYNYENNYEYGTSKISGCSKAATATVTATSVKKPTLRSATAGKKRVTLKWKKVTGADGYAIYRSTKKKSGYIKIAEVTKGSTVKYIDKTAKSKTRYYYKIRAIKYNEAGATTYSSYSKVKNARAK